MLLLFKMFDLRRITLFCLWYRLSKHKWLYVLNICGGHGPVGPSATSMPAGKGADTSELQARHCMTPEQWTWLLRSVSVTPATKLLLQEINQLIEIELLTSNFLKRFSS